MVKKKILERRKKLLEALWFFIKFNLLVIPLYVLLYVDFSLPQLQIFLTNVLAATLNAMKYNVTAQGYFLNLLVNGKMMTIDISMDCTGWKSMCALAALVIATPSKLNKKGKFLLISLPFLFFLNFIRILTTIIASLNLGFQYMEVIHTFLWREGLIFAVVAIWYLWLRKIYNIRWTVRRKYDRRK